MSTADLFLLKNKVTNTTNLTTMYIQGWIYSEANGAYASRPLKALNKYSPLY